MIRARVGGEAAGWLCKRGSHNPSRDLVVDGGLAGSPPRDSGHGGAKPWQDAVVPRRRPDEPHVESRARRAGRAVVGFANGLTIVIAALAALAGLVFLLVDRAQAPANPNGDIHDAEQTVLHELYERGVGEICATLNEESKGIAARAGALPILVRRARSTRRQRDLLLDAQNDAVGLSTETLARLERRACRA